MNSVDGNLVGGIVIVVTVVQEVGASRSGPKEVLLSGGIVFDMLERVDSKWCLVGGRMCVG